MTECWRPISEYDGFYSVSDHGRVRSEPRTIMRKNGRPCTRRGEVLTPTRHKSGRLSVKLSYYGIGTTHYVHRLVMAAFVGECPTEMETCHWDDDPTNNHLSNLRYDTRSANMHDKVRNGKHHRANATHCVHGHEFTLENTYRYGNRRQCKTCITNRDKARRQQRKEHAA